MVSLLLSACLLLAPSPAVVVPSPVVTPSPVVVPSPIVMPPPDAVTPPPDPAAGERSDGRLEPMPKRRWRLLPEALLLPLRGLLWLVAYPAGAGLRSEDRHHTMERVLAAVTWSDGRRTLRPAFYYSTTYVPQLGLRYEDHLSLGVDTTLALTATTFGGRYVYSAFTVEPTRASSPVGVIVDVAFDRRADLLYNGLGHHTYDDNAAGRYLMNGLESRLGLRIRATRWLALYAVGSTGLKRFSNGDPTGGDPDILNVYDPATIPGFVHGTTFVRIGTGFVIDLRDAVARAATGLLLRGGVDYTKGIDGDVSSYERLRLSAALPINLWARTHVLWLQAATALTWQNEEAVPFSELPTLGGPDDLRGFRYQDFRDYTSFVASAEYRWPIWMWVDAALFVDYGGVFGQSYAGFGARRMQPDVGVAIHIVTSSRFYMRAQLGYGFGEGFNFFISGNRP